MEHIGIHWKFIYNKDILIIIYVMSQSFENNECILLILLEFWCEVMDWAQTAAPFPLWDPNTMVIKFIVELTHKKKGAGKSIIIIWKLRCIYSQDKKNGWKYIYIWNQKKKVTTQLYNLENRG